MGRKLLLFLVVFFTLSANSAHKQQVLSRSYATFTPAIIYQGAAQARCNEQGGCFIDLAVVSAQGGSGTVYRFKGTLISLRDFSSVLGEVQIIENNIESP